MPTQKFRLLNYYEILVTFNRNSLILNNCQNFFRLFWGHIEALFYRETAIQLRKTY